MKLIMCRDDKDIKVFDRIRTLMNLMANEGVFHNNETRLALSYPTFLITNNNQDIGFIYFVEESYGKLLAVDIGLIPEYRGKGIAVTILQSVLNTLKGKTEGYIVAQASPENKAAIKSLNKLGALNISENYFLLEPERYEKFQKEFNQGLINFNVACKRQRIS